jgi:hypothetical protein
LILLIRWYALGPGLRRDDEFKDLFLFFHSLSGLSAYEQ